MVDKSVIREESLSWWIGFFRIPDLNSLILRSFYHPRITYLNKTTVGGKGAARGHSISGEDIDAASSVQSLGVRAKPSARVQASHSRHDAVRDFSNREELASIIEHSDLITGIDAPRLGVSGVEPDRIVGQRL